MSRIFISCVLILTCSYFHSGITFCRKYSRSRDMAEKGENVVGLETNVVANAGYSEGDNSW